MVLVDHGNGSPQESVRSSLVQQGVWITERAADVGSVYHVPLSIDFTGELNLAALLQSCQDVTRRHPILTASVADEHGVPMLRPGAHPCHPEVDDLSALPPAERDRQLDKRTRELILRPFDLTAGPLIRFTVFLLAPGRARLVIVGHHVGFDGQSKDILVRDLAACHHARVTGEAPDLPALKASYQELVDDHLARVEQLLPDAREHWARRWRDPHQVTLPGRRRVAEHVTAGVSYEFTLDPQLRSQIADTASQLGISRFELLLAAYQTLLFRYGNPDPVIALDLGTRPEAATDHIGVFINEALVNSEVSGQTPFRDAARALRRQLRELYAFREVPVPRAVPAVRPGITLAPVSFSYRRRAAAPTFTGVDAEVDWTVFNLARRNALHVLIIESAEQTTVSLEHTDGAFSDAAIRRIGEHYQQLLSAAVADPGVPVSRLPLLGPGERAQVLQGWNATSVDLASPDTALHLFHRQVLRTPDAVAALCGADALTYAQLDSYAGRLAAALRQRDVKAGDVVALCAPRSTMLVAALLAVWKAGAAYVPLDARHPEERLAYVLRDSGATLLLAGAEHADQLRSPALAAGVEVARLDQLLDSAPPDSVPPAGGGEVGPAGLGYVIYTSGSTGRPKGVAVGHGSVANLVHAMRQALDRAPQPATTREPRQASQVTGQSWLAVSSLSFDISVLELLAPLTSGGRVVLAQDADVRDGAALARLIRRHSVTHVQATPTTWQLLLDAGLPEQPLIALCGGEALPSPLAAALREKTAELWNVYGPTETTIWSTAWHVPRASASAGQPPASDTIGQPPASDTTGGPLAGVAPIGKPLANTQCRVLDDAGNPTPIGIEGELAIGGAGLAWGYHGNPRLTAERFTPDPYGAPGARLYRTGDRARWREDGVLEFLGRADGQVKLRGHRIELGEVEASLLSDARVSQALAMVREDTPGNRRLVAYAVLAPAQSAAPEELLAGIRTRLPEHSVPAALVLLDVMPTTPSGKRDAAALPAPPRLRDEPQRADSGPTTGRDAAPAHTASAGDQPTPAAGAETDPGSDAVTRSVTEIWQEVLDLDGIGAHEDLFELGGHSLTVTQIASRIRKRLGVDLPIYLLYDHSTIAGQAHAVAQAQATAGPQAENQAGPQAGSQTGVPRSAAAR